MRAHPRHNPHCSWGQVSPIACQLPSAGTWLSHWHICKQHSAILQLTVTADKWSQKLLEGQQASSRCDQLSNSLSRHFLPHSIHSLAALYYEQVLIKKVWSRVNHHRHSWILWNDARLLQTTIFMFCDMMVFCSYTLSYLWAEKKKGHTGSFSQILPTTCVVAHSISQMSQQPFFHTSQSNRSINTILSAAHLNSIAYIENPMAVFVFWPVFG